MDVAATLLAELVGSVDATDRGVLDFLSSEIQALFVEWQFVLKLNSLVFLW